MGFWEEFSVEEKAALKRAIEVAEMHTSGEIRVHLEHRCKKNLFDRAADIFKKLDMHQTVLRNGILFYVSISDRKLVIMGDRGINAKVPENFWSEIRETVLDHFRAGRITEGLREGIRMAGEQLGEHFPRSSEDVDELPNEISVGETE